MTQSSLSLLKQGRHRMWLVTLIAVAVLLRLVVAFYLGNTVEILPGTFDQVSYDMLAHQILEGHGFTVADTWWPITPAGEPTAHWSYLYTLYLVLVYSLVGYQPIVARIIQAVLAGILMPWLAYRLGQRHFNFKVGLTAAALTGFYTYFVYYAATLMTETFYIIAILWTLNLAGDLSEPAKGLDHGLKNGWVWLGLALSVTVLLRQVFLLLIPVLFLWIMWRNYRHRLRTVYQTLGTLIGAAAILIAMILPWTIRNYLAFDTFVLLNTNAGFAFFWGNHPIHGYNFISILPHDGPSYQSLIPSDLLDLNEAKLDKALLAQSFGFIQEEPVRYVVLSISRLKDYFKFWPSSDSSTLSNLGRVVSFGILWPFMIYGLISRFRQSLTSETLLLYLFVVIYTGIHLLSWALIRYRLPVDAILILFAAAALVDIKVLFTRRTTNTRHHLNYEVSQ